MQNRIGNSFAYYLRVYKFSLFTIKKWKLSKPKFQDKLPELQKTGFQSFAVKTKLFLFFSFTSIAGGNKETVYLRRIPCSKEENAGPCENDMKSIRYLLNSFMLYDFVFASCVKIQTLHEWRSKLAIQIKLKSCEY